MKPALTVRLCGTDQQIAAALRDLADRVLRWSGDHDTGAESSCPSHAPMAHKGNDTIAAYRASFDDWED